MEEPADVATPPSASEPESAVRRLPTPTHESATTAQGIALRDADAQRMLRGYRLASGLCLSGSVALQFVGEATTLRGVLTAVVAAAGLLTGAIAHRHRDGSSFTNREATVGGLALACTILAAIAYGGVLSSPVVLMVVLLIPMTMADERRGKLGAILLMGGYAVLGVLLLAGVLSPAPMFVDDRAAQVVGLLLVEVTVLAGYALGRTARATTAQALDRVHQAQLELARRTALLREARADLERAQQGGKLGRLSGREVKGYRLEEIIGRGGMGEVYRAESLGGGGARAVKILHPHLADDEVQVERFFREAKICSQLDSPHIAAVHDHGVTPDGAPFLVMDLLEGETLSDRLRRQGKLSVADAGQLLRQVSHALQTAHDAGVIHRDIKPSNLWHTATEPARWVVLDFGVSKLAQRGLTLTRGDMVGTPGYMAPEQAHGADVDARADVFALGAVLYRVLTGQPPFAGPDAMSTILRAVQDQPVRPGALVRLRPDVDLVVALALAKHADERLASAEQLDQAFSSALDRGIDAHLRARAHRLIERSPWAAVEVEEPPTVILT